MIICTRRRAPLNKGFNHTTNMPRVMLDQSLSYVQDLSVGSKKLPYQYNSILWGGEMMNPRQAEMKFLMLSVTNGHQDYFTAAEWVWI